MSLASIDMVQSAGPEHNWEKYYLLKKGDVFVEIGPFWGRYGMVASRKGCSKVVLIEPSPYNVATIQNLINKGGIKNAIVVAKAVTLEKKTIPFVVHGNPAGHRLSVGAHDFPADTVQVIGDTLDNIFIESGIDHVDLLASDCEGCEVNIVRSAAKYFSEGKIKNIALGTYHGPDNHKLVSDELLKYGFKALKYEDGITYGHL